MAASARGVFRRAPSAAFPIAGLLLLLLATMRASSPETATGATGRTFAGVRPALAHFLRIQANVAAGLSGSARGDGVDPARGATAERLIVARRLCDGGEDQMWRDALTISTIGDHAGAEAYLREAKSDFRDGARVDMLRAVWIRWLDEGDTSGAARMLVTAWNAGELPLQGRRLAVTLTRLAGDHVAARGLLERHRVESPDDEAWSERESEVFRGIDP